MTPRVPPIDVEPEVFDAASTVLGQTVADRLTTALTSLQDALFELGAMAGTDPGGQSWASAYDPAAADTIAAMTDLINACYQLAAMLERTGFNHGMAEASSDPTRSVPTPADRTRYGALHSLAPATAPPTARGGSGSAPTGWGTIAHLVGYVWPNGHQDRLRTAAAAWTAASHDLDFASYDLDEAVEAIAGQRSPEINDATAVVRSMKQHIQDVAAACRGLAQSCSDYAGHLDDAHSQIEHELASFLEWTAGIETGGALLSIISLGSSEAAAQALEAERAATTAARVANIIARFIELAGTVAEAVGKVVSKVGEVAQRLKVILGARLSAASSRLVARLPALADDTGAISFGRLTAWDLGWARRGLSIEEKLGGNLPRSFPTIDRFKKGVATSIKSVDLTSKTYQDTSRLASTLRRYVDKVADFDGATWGGQEVDGDEITQRVLHVAIQPGVQTPGQRAVFDQIAEYAKTKRVRMIVTEVP